MPAGWGRPSPARRIKEWLRRRTPSPKGTHPSPVGPYACCPLCPARRSGHRAAHGRRAPGEGGHRPHRTLRAGTAVGDGRPPACGRAVQHVGHLQGLFPECGGAAGRLLPGGPWPQLHAACAGGRLLWTAGVWTPTRVVPTSAAVAWWGVPQGPGPCGTLRSEVSCRPQPLQPLLLCRCHCAWPASHALLPACPLRILLCSAPRRRTSPPSRTSSASTRWP